MATHSSILAWRIPWWATVHDTTLMAESEKELKSLLRRVKEKSEGLKFNIQKTKIMASGPINFMAYRWRESGRSDRFYFGGLQNRSRQ